MAHFAQLDENNIVLQVIVVHNDQLLDSDGIELEDNGVSFCKSLFGANTIWKQTSYNGNFCGKYAAIGDTFNGTEFVSPSVDPVVTTDNATDTITVDAGTGSDTIGI